MYAASHMRSAPWTDLQRVLFSSIMSFEVWASLDETQALGILIIYVVETVEYNVI